MSALTTINTQVVIKWLSTSGLKILLIIGGAILLLRAIYHVIERMERMVEDEDPTSLSERERRARTLGGILRRASLFTILAIAVIMIMDVLNFDIRPLITAAGIGGVALGFGAQNLIRDFLAGFFILLENQVRVGDAVTINGVSGWVETISLRTITLRDLEGTVHIFPNGAITSLANRSKDWSRYLIDLPVSYAENLERVIAVLQEVGEELAADPRFRQMIVEPLQILGVDNFGDSAIIVKLVVTTQPLRQWDVGRELRRRIKARFDQEGIAFPYPQLTVHMAQGAEPASPPSRLADGTPGR